METALAVASKRDVRHFDSRPIPAEVQERILDAGRLAGSAHNRQPWRLVVTEQPALRAGLATAVYAPANVVGRFVASVAGPNEDRGSDVSYKGQRPFLMPFAL